ncbi:hypothetical protein [Nocardioides houyundeii]|uniref:hypothetical protein n=1 Tax=Nocardioides houyundeii TaxID=2045452 RepID=UPI0013B43219|nr:hypothetical protein [Nocardioides houyundeii]
MDAGTDGSDHESGHEAVSQDPFWSVVRRRHPDIDVVLLPPAAGGSAETPPGVAVQEPETVATHADESVRRTWARLVGDHASAVRVETRWLPGGAPDRIRRETTLTAEGVETSAGVRRLREAIGLLEGDGWHVFVPPRGVPRLNAGQGADQAAAEDAELAAGLGRRELLMVLVPESHRLVLRVRSADHVVGAGARELIGQEES